jgi:protein-tyrosine phosphatase
VTAPAVAVTRQGGRGDGTGDTLGVMTADPRPRHLPLEGTRNVRDTGGYPAAGGRVTRWRTLLRSDELTRVPPGVADQLVALGLRRVIDLRWREELEYSPNAFADSSLIRYTSIPLLADDPTPHAGLAGMYKHVLDARGTQLAEVVHTLLGEDGLPAVVGCAAGKDRTGVTIALLLDLCGVPRAVIVEDYALSAQYFASPRAHIEADDWRSGSLVVDSPPEFMESALAHLDRYHGGARALLRRHGVTDDEMDRLVDLLTEPADR